jgi:phosphoglycolate phosphatase
MIFVFDLDGTLIDSARDLAESASELVEGYGAAPLTADDVVPMVGDGAAVLVRRALERSGLDPDLPGGLARFLEIYDRRLLAHTRPYPGMAEVLAGLIHRGPLAVLTNKPAGPSHTILDALGLRGFFGALIGGDGPWPRKPDPAGLRALMDGTPGPAVMVGDSPADYRTALAAGAIPVLARYGFGFGRFEGAVPPDVLVVDHPRELLSIADTITFDAARVPIVMR